MNQMKLKVVDRRTFIIGAGASAAALTGLASLAQATPQEAADFLAKLTGGKKPAPGKVKLGMPEIAENGATVPVKVSADTPQNEGDNCKSIAIIATKNPRPRMCVFHFTPRSGKAFAAIRVRLATTQEVWAVAEMSDGSWHIAKTTVKVTIGGCGG
jgi:sulfur-oxidizing protein SoxY